jgi:hypothetical protein
MDKRKSEIQIRKWARDIISTPYETTPTTLAPPTQLYPLPPSTPLLSYNAISTRLALGTNSIPQGSGAELYVVPSYDDAGHSMVPTQAPTISTISEPRPPLTSRSTAPPDRALLAPEDAIYQGSLPKKQPAAATTLHKDLHMTAEDTSKLPRRGRRKDGNRSASRRRKGTWKKLLWVKQSCEHPLVDVPAIADSR